MLAADYSQWPFKNPAHSITAAQRAYIAATRQEHDDTEEEAPLTKEQLLAMVEGQANVTPES